MNTEETFFLLFVLIQVIILIYYLIKEIRRSPKQFKQSKITDYFPPVHSTINNE